MKKKFLAGVLSLVMILSLLPMTVFAGDGNVCKIGKTEYATLKAAVEAVPDNTETTITMIADVDFGDVSVKEAEKNTGVTIPANKKIILDLAGFKISAIRTDDKSAQTIKNYGDLTIMDSSESETGLIIMHSGETTDPWDVSSSGISNSKNLTIKSGNIESGDLSGSYGIDSLQNDYSYDVNLIIEGGYIKSQYRGVRLFCNGTKGSDNIKVTDGTIEGGEAVALWIQNPSGLKNKADIIIEGGTFVNASGNAFSVSGGADNSGISLSITNGKFYGAISSPIPNFISGGLILNIGKWTYADYGMSTTNLNSWFIENKDKLFDGNTYTIETYNKLPVEQKFKYGYKFDYYGIYEDDGYWFVYTLGENENVYSYPIVGRSIVKNSDPETKEKYPYTIGHNVTFMNGETEHAVVGVVHDDKVDKTLVKNPTKDNNTFAGWVYDTTGEPFLFNTSITEDITVKASWIANEKEGNITVKDKDEGIKAETSIKKSDIPLTSEEIEKIETGSKLDVDLVVKVEEAKIVKEKEKELIKEAMEENQKLGMYLDCSMFKTLDGKPVGEIHETLNPVTIVLTVPENLRANDREYSIIRVHDGEAEILFEGKANKDWNISFDTDKFSTYAIAYVGGTEIVPKTGDYNNIGLFVCLGVLALLGIIALSVVLLKRKTNNR